MSLSKEAITRIAGLARIELNSDEQDRFATELSKIVEWIEHLSEVNTDDTSPLDHAVHYTQRLRPDVVEHDTSAEAVLKNATNTTLDFFSVPKVVE